MTRKRFVKLLMARGFSRNKANRIAQEKPNNIPYTMLMVRYPKKHRPGIDIKIAVDGFEKFTESMQRALNATPNLTIPKISVGALIKPIQQVTMVDGPEYIFGGIDWGCGEDDRRAICREIQQNSRGLLF